MGAKEASMLREKDERLISKWLDGECGWLERWRAGRLLRGSQAARNFLENMQAVRCGAQCWGESACRCQVDLWDRIAARIDQEQRAEVFLGRRRAAAADVRESRFSPWTLGVSGAAVAAAAALLLVFLPGGAGNTGPGGRALVWTADSGSVPGVNLASAGGVQPRVVSGGVELDWMRSHAGRVKLIQDPSGRSPIIWVTKRKPQPQTPYYRVTGGSGPVMMVEKSHSESLADYK